VLREVNLIKVEEYRLLLGCQLQSLVLHFGVGRLPNYLLRENNGGLLAIIRVEWLDPAKHSHVSFERNELLLLYLSDLLIL
jgi:hypothetical protein